jgi:hypothetical protein
MRLRIPVEQQQRRPAAALTRLIVAPVVSICRCSKPGKKSGIVASISLVIPANACVRGTVFTRQTLFRKGDNRRGLIGCKLQALSRNSTVMQSGKVIGYNCCTKERPHGGGSLRVCSRRLLHGLADVAWVIIRGRVRSAVVSDGKLTPERKSCEYSVSVEPATGELVT